ncbi:hypothetical protein CSAL01_13468 [Colletotrichum salicis]|uniref:Uncharacterized protein n=1 Tax=Colletotrichum salicis TaxID=1209931 RepID=A0A135V093_9PEZI|nr:hypothetical protein CSAL01_13468 [Colletotrichum salicis]
MRAVFAIVSLLAATVAARFDGPCTDTVCGESNVNCEAEGRICVGFPSVDPEKRIGCTCSIKISHTTFPVSDVIFSPTVSSLLLVTISSASAVMSVLPGATPVLPSFSRLLPEIA